ncbi:MAG: hypothetical protein CMK59_08470 [Proteobacteria bacterium]|nr:hypothetical protein [Pseudomonadota bacterium]
MIFLLFLPEAKANCLNEPILQDLTCSSILSAQIDFYQAGTLNNYYCDANNVSLQENTCYNAQLSGMDCYWGGTYCECYNYSTYTYETQYWLWDQGANEDVYSFVCQQTGTVTALISDLDCDLDLYVLDSTCYPSSLGSCIQGSDNWEFYGDSVSFSCVAGQTYYLVVEGFGATTDSFSYSAACSTSQGNYTLSFDIAAGTGCSEDCVDGIDNDVDGFIDCDDSDCFGDALCVNCDVDGDGHSDPSCGGFDCDDSNPSINPSAPEVCDGIDNNCNALIDDGTGSVYYVDADADGFGNSNYYSLSCTQPAGYASLANDCNDGNSAIYPSAPEICDELDNDCNGVVDDGLGAVWYQDNDGDGAGNYNVSTMTCYAPAGYVAAGGDCDDNNPNVYAGLTEICDGIDNNCNAIIDEGLLQSLYVDADGDGYGNTSQPEVGCSEGGGLSLQNGDCDDANATVYPAALEICDGLDNDCNSLIDDGVTYSSYYLDSDGDGHGSAASMINDCISPDGYALVGDDCDDSDASVSPSSVEIPYDGIDQDCSGSDLCDQDEDGFDEDGPLCQGTDCFDLSPSVYPGAVEHVDGIDESCDGIVDENTSVYDDDGDGFSEFGGDCDDTQASTTPFSEEICDGIDNDCDMVIDENTECYDDDGDGFSEQDGDCNDNTAAISPSVVEHPLNGIDDNCDGIVDGSATDLDQDGLSEDSGDCDDNDPTVGAGFPEQADGIDNDCDGEIDEGTENGDDDGDGFAEADGDCNDQDATTYPFAPEQLDGRDNNCDGWVDNNTEASDDDGDGITEQAGDCDDSNADVAPGLAEQLDGIDNDCDGLADEGLYDVDQDGYSFADGDCDDNNGWANPGLDELCDGFDNNCNGEIDENLADCTLNDTPDNSNEDSIVDEIQKDINEASCATAKSPFWSAWLLLIGMLLPRRRSYKHSQNS